MQVQETITNATANLFGSTATVLIAVIAVAAFAFGAEQIAELFEVRLPVRQLMAGRSLQALTLSGRSFCVLACSYITGRFTACKPKGHVLVAD